MIQNIARVTVLVKDYQEAIDYYVSKLGFKLIENTPLDETKRWVVVAPGGADGCQLVLARAVNNRQADSIGNQTGGRVFLFLQTDDFWRDYHRYVNAGVKFREKPREEAYGTVAVFEDLYGNLWDLIQPGPDVN